MCMNCGCGMPDDAHGNPDNITAKALRRAGDANGHSMRTTAHNIMASVEAMGGAGTARDPRSIREPAGVGGAMGSGRAERGTPATES
jgi:hypothetical protein